MASKVMNFQFFNFYALIINIECFFNENPNPSWVFSYINLLRKQKIIFKIGKQNYQQGIWLIGTLTFLEVIFSLCFKFAVMIKISDTGI